MQQTSTALRAGLATGNIHPVPVRRLHATGHQVSILSSLAIAVIISVFFFALRGWAPSPEWQMTADFAVTWVLLSYIWVQMGSLILVGSGTKNQMWLDAFTSIIPLFLIAYVILQHYTDFLVISDFQVKAAWATAYTMLLDVVIDLGLSVLLSRQVVDIGSSGVA